MKTLGIIGGLGPQTTSKVYLSVIDLIKKSGRDEYPPIVIYNLPFPFIIEDEAIIQGINSEKMIPYLIEGAKTLERSGANFAILPCNTLHKYITEIRESVKLPFLSILEETVLFLKFKKIETVGILATETTIKSKIYENILKNNKIHVVYPSLAEQEIINNIIVELLNSRDDNSHTENIQAICDSMFEKGVNNILLACTDLQLIKFSLKNNINIIDTTDILIEASVRELLNNDS
ncbi:MAG: amino acid racemase [Candidatus Nomurabacteria bacterium]|nr:amino acid racemase [Candidatus Nomurabacteria bacterium]